MVNCPSNEVRIVVAQPHLTVKMCSGEFGLVGTGVLTARVLKTADMIAGPRNDILFVGRWSG